MMVDILITVGDENKIMDWNPVLNCYFFHIRISPKKSHRSQLLGMIMHMMWRRHQLVVCTSLSLSKLTPTLQVDAFWRLILTKKTFTIIYDWIIAARAQKFGRAIN